MVKQTNNRHLIVLVAIFFSFGFSLFSFSLFPLSAAPLADAIEITKLVDKTSVDAEELIEYTLQYSCSSIEVTFCTDVVITDVLPAALDATNVTLVGSPHTVSAVNDNGVIKFTFITTMTAGTTGEVKIRAQFPVGPPDGTLAVNSAEIHANEGASSSNPVTTTLTYSTPPDLDDITAGKEYGNGSSFQVGEEVSYAVYGRNDGDNGLENFYFEDFLPTSLQFSGFESGEWTHNVPVTITYQTNVTPTWTTWPASFVWNSDDSHTVSELGLGSGEFVTALRWSFGDVPANFSHDGTRPRIEAIVLPSNAPGDTIQNCNVVYGDGYAGVISDTTCYDISVEAPPATVTDTITAGKERGNYDEFAVGGEVSYAVYARNDGENSLDNFYFEDFLPNTVEFVSFESGGWTNNVPLTITYQTNVTATWTAWPSSFSWNSDDYHNVSELGLGSGEFVSALRWDFGTVPGNFSHDGNRPRINATVLLTNTVGDVIQNCNAAYGDGISGVISDTTCFNIDIIEPETFPWVSKYVSSGSNTVDQGERFTVTLRVGDSPYASANFVNPTIMDLLPAGISYAGAYTLSDTSYSVPTFTVSADHDGTGRTLLRWEWDDLTLVPNEYFGIEVGLVADSDALGVITNEYEVTSEDTPFTDCYGEDGFRADQYDMDGDGDRTERFCWENTDITVRPDGPMPKATKTLISSGTFIPGQTITWEVRAENLVTGTASYNNPIVMDLLPSQLEYMDSWVVISNTGESVPAPIFETLANHDGTGRTLLRWSWTGASAYALDDGDYLAIRFATRIKDGTGGTITNDYDLTSNDTPASNCAGTLRADLYDMDGDVDRAEMHCSAAADLAVELTAALESEKLVRGQLDADYSKYPEVGATIPGGIDDYKLTISNPGNVTMTNIIIYDILPYVGDTGVKVTTARNSQWRPNLVGSIEVPAGVVAYYSTSTNPCRPEIIAAGPVGCVDDWSIVLPADPTTVSAIKLDFGSVLLAPADSLALAWPMRAPIDAPTGGEIAWNSFAYTADRADNGDTLLPAEPIKVGVATLPQDPAVYGNFVWIDSDRDGIQDAGEVGIDGVRVELYRDNGDGINDPANDTLENFTLTTDGGQYIFPNLDAGDYYAVVYLPPTYSMSLPDQTADEEADSDGSVGTFNDHVVAIMPVTTLDANEIDESWDQGIFQPAILKSAVGSYVWFDDNGDGTQNESSTNGLNGITVNLFDNDDPSTPISTTVTRDDVNGNAGFFLFDQLDPGDYFIAVELPGGATFTVQGATGSSDPIDSDVNPANGMTEVFTLTGGEYDSTWKAGIILETGPLTIGNRIWHDVNNDGDYDPFDGENGIDNVDVTLYIDTDGSGDYTPGTDEFRATTSTYTKGGEAGYYEFTNLPAGDYIVQVISKNFAPGQPLGKMSSSTGNGVAPDPDDNVDNDDNGEPMDGHGVVSQSLTISNTLEPTSEDGDNNTNMTVDFGFYIEPAAIGNFVWIDEDHDGIQDESELPLQGVTITLVIAYPDGTTITQTEISDVNGFYSFDDLQENEHYSGVDPTYTISAESPAGYMPTTVNASGSTNSNDSNAHSGTMAEPIAGEISVAANVTTTIASYDFGFWQPLAIGNFLWDDTDGATPNNGIYEPATEVGIDGVTLYLYRDNGDGSFDINTDTLVTQTVTVNGFYLFDNLEPDDYFIHVPDTAFQPGGALYDSAASKAYTSVTNATTPTDDSADHDSGENGIDSASPEATGITTNRITLGRADEPTSELQSSPTGYNDENANLTVDLAFYLLAPTAVQLSNLNTGSTDSLLPLLSVTLLGLALMTRYWLKKQALR